MQLIQSFCSSGAISDQYWGTCSGKTTFHRNFTITAARGPHIYSAAVSPCMCHSELPVDPLEKIIDTASLRVRVRCAMAARELLVFDHKDACNLPKLLQLRRYQRSVLGYLFWENHL